MTTDLRVRLSAQNAVTLNDAVIVDAAVDAVVSVDGLTVRFDLRDAFGHAATGVRPVHLFVLDPNADTICAMPPALTAVTGAMDQAGAHAAALTDADGCLSFTAAVGGCRLMLALSNGVAVVSAAL